jgi:hypothetical protein
MNGRPAARGIWRRACTAIGFGSAWLLVRALSAQERVAWRTDRRSDIIVRSSRRVKNKVGTSSLTRPTFSGGRTSLRLFTTRKGTEISVLAEDAIGPARYVVNEATIYRHRMPCPNWEKWRARNDSNVRPSDS